MKLKRLGNKSKTLNNKRNVLIVLSGPSGVGKGTIAKKLIEQNKNIALSISCTTRRPREGELNGRDYFFIEKSEFKNKVEQGGFLEYSEHFENFYGTPKQFVLNTLENKDVLLEIDVNGGLEVKKNFPDAVLIMLLPPSLEEVRNRLIKRDTESLAKINLRMDRIDYELSKKELYDYNVVNDDLKTAIKEVEKIIYQEKNK
ncbi:MAG: guanylate kinase [Clostridiales bacterium]|nr:guanylate kinase [Clostridiales bacterium]